MARSLRSSFYASGYDIWGEGASQVVSNITGRGGASGVTLSVSYHDGRDIFPHNPKSKLRYLEPGAVYFQPDYTLYDDTPVVPVESEMVRDGFDALAALADESGKAGTEFHAWTVFLHRDKGRDDYEWAIKTCFGDPLLTDLCPANPQARRYCVALARDITRYGVGSVVSESLHYAPLEHGYHHERYFLPLGPTSRFLLGLCFCEFCMAEARHRGVEAEGVRQAARDHLIKVFELGDDQAVEDVNQEEIGSMLGGQMAGYIDMRASVVSSLASEVAEACHASNTPFIFGDLSGAVKGYATGRPTGSSPTEIAWRIGIDWAQLRGAVDGVQALTYAADPARIETDVSKYVQAAGTAGVSAVFRPAVPDCSSADNLREKVRVARRLGVASTDFYHYGFTPLSALDLIATALHED
jgi:hypothetical protein